MLHCTGKEKGYCTYIKVRGDLVQQHIPQVHVRLLSPTEGHDDAHLSIRLIRLGKRKEKEEDEEHEQDARTPMSEPSRRGGGRRTHTQKKGFSKVASLVHCTQQHSTRSGETREGMTKYYTRRPKKHNKLQQSCLSLPRSPSPPFFFAAVFYCLLYVGASLLLRRRAPSQHCTQPARSLTLCPCVTNFRAFLSLTP